MSSQQQAEDLSQGIEDASSGSGSASGKIPLGGIGYTFRKLFPGHGWFEGSVIEIRPKVCELKYDISMYESARMKYFFFIANSFEINGMVLMNGCVL